MIQLQPLTKQPSQCKIQLRIIFKTVKSYPEFYTPADRVEYYVISFLI
jgi:hypothetical protein